MMFSETANLWSRQFGLAASPFMDWQQAEGEHCVLLDGGMGTFALSISDTELWKAARPAEWIWSSDIPHHVTVTPSKVAVVRWDQPDDAKVYGRSGVERSLDKFYDYLFEDRVRSNKTVVEHLLGLFRRVRSLTLEARLTDTRTTDVFAAVLDRLISQEGQAQVAIGSHGLAPDSNELLARLHQKGLEAALEEIQCATGSLSQLKLHPSLSIRHAGGQIFQEAHFELLRGGKGFDLLGLVDVPVTSRESRGGTHFTPPSLARSIVEHALNCIDGIELRKELTVCDPACGSGAFLHETLRALQRTGFKGRIKLVGHDVSAPATAMARFVLARALLDWTPEGGAEVVLQVGDSLAELGIPCADVIVMNPPFISSGSQSPTQQEQLRQAIDGSAVRGDYSMAFVVRALEALKIGGVIGTLFPASLLSLKAAAAWREKLISLGQVRMLGSLGDFGLFSQAIVQVACAVLTRVEKPVSGEFLAVISDSDSKSTSGVLRQLRKTGVKPLQTPITEAGWQLFPVQASILKGRGTWKIPTPGAERGLREIADARLPTVADLFEVSQGIQTGFNDALLLTLEEWNGLPAKERKYFRPASMTDTIQNGSFKKPYRVFFPHTQTGPLFVDEAEVRQALPNYWARFLAPFRDRLQSRASITLTGRADWWGLMRPRAYAFSSSPRIISKFFTAEGGFACDLTAEFIPVMGHMWMPKPRIAGVEAEAKGAEAQTGLALEDILLAYTALLNSEPFMRLLSIFSPHVAGGQFDVSSRYVRQLPMPDLREASLDVAQGRIVADLSVLGREIDLASATWRSSVAFLVASLYGSQHLLDD